MYDLSHQPIDTMSIDAPDYSLFFFVSFFFFFLCLLFFFNDTSPTEIYTLSLHDALPICAIAYLREKTPLLCSGAKADAFVELLLSAGATARALPRSEEHTSELQSRLHLVCRLLLEKKKETKKKKKQSKKRVVEHVSLSSSHRHCTPVHEYGVVA